MWIREELAVMIGQKITDINYNPINRWVWTNIKFKDEFNPEAD